MHRDARLHFIESFCWIKNLSTNKISNVLERDARISNRQWQRASWRAIYHRSTENGSSHLRQIFILLFTRSSLAILQGHFSARYQYQTIWHSIKIRITKSTHTVNLFHIFALSIDDDSRVIDRSQLPCYKTLQLFRVPTPKHFCQIPKLVRNKLYRQCVATDDYRQRSRRQTIMKIQLHM